MGIKDIISTNAGNLLSGVVKDTLVEKIDVYYLDEVLKRDILDKLCDLYGNETFFNDLDKYITGINLLSSLINALRGTASSQPCNKSEFIKHNAQNFLNSIQKKKKKASKSEINRIFGFIYDDIENKILMLSPHTNLGKIQRSIHNVGAETQSQISNMQADISNLTNAFNNFTSMISIGVLSEDLNETKNNKQSTGFSIEYENITEKIKEIENEYHQSYLFNEALDQYIELLQIIPTLSIDKNQIIQLCCKVNCNIALCYSNLDKPENAFNSLIKIPEEIALADKSYNYIYAAIIAQHNVVDKFSLAVEHLDRALEIDSNYHKAYILKNYFIIQIDTDKANDILPEYNKKLKELLKDNNIDLMADYYFYRGLIYQANNDFNHAINDYEEAIKHGYDIDIANLNIAIALYKQATIDVPKDDRLLFPDINIPLMIKTNEILHEIVIKNQFLNMPCNALDMTLSLYASSCLLLNKLHDLNPLEKYINLTKNYEIQRILIASANGILPDNCIAILDSKDKFFIKMRSLVESDKLQECKKSIISYIELGSDDLSPPIFHMLTQICLILKKVDEYWKYRDLAINNGLNGSRLEMLDAYANELSGDIHKAKEIYDKISALSNDYTALENVLRFYARNKYTNERKDLIIRIHECLIKRQLYIYNADDFYDNTISFFIKIKNECIEKILNEISIGIVSEEAYYNLHAKYYDSIKDIIRLSECLSHIFKLTGDIKAGYSLALCKQWLFEYDEALSLALSLLEKSPDENEIIDLYWLISNLYLFKNNNDDSCEWADKAHELAINNPYDPSHQAFLGRIMRCDKLENLGKLVKFKEEHPVVVKWLESFVLPESSDDLLASLQNAIEEKFPGTGDYHEKDKEISRTYRKGIMPFNLLHDYYKEEWWRIFQFALKNKIHISLGILEIIKAEEDSISDKIVIDAQTLVIMTFFGCLPALRKIKQVHIPISSIIKLQYYYMNLSYHYVKKVIDWISSAKNLVIEPDGYIDNDSFLVKTFSRDFIACCNVSLKDDIPYVYCDSVVKKYQSSIGFEPLNDIRFISIPSLCRYSMKKKPNILNQMLYDLLKGCEFISFRAETITHQIRKNKYMVTNEIIEPFLICKTEYDMRSFAYVYLGAISELYDENIDAAHSLAIILLSDAKRIWKRGDTYRALAPRNGFDDYIYKAAMISEYVKYMLKGIKEIFITIPDLLIEPYDELMLLIKEK